MQYTCIIQHNSCLDLVDFRMTVTPILATTKWKNMLSNKRIKRFSSECVWTGYYVHIHFTSLQKPLTFSANSKTAIGLLNQQPRDSTEEDGLS